jgi:hypothetical protein
MFTTIFKHLKSYIVQIKRILIFLFRVFLLGYSYSLQTAKR